MKRHWILGTLVLFIGVLSLGLYFNPNVAASIKKQIFGDEPDIPDFAKYKINKEEFMTRRAEQIAMFRGIEKDKPFDPHIRVEAIRQMEVQEQLLARSFAPQAAWTEIGPNPIPNGQTNVTSTAVSGRTIAIAVHPTNPNIVYVGTAQGGLYRTTDGGTTWLPLMDNALSLAIGAIAIAPSQPDTIYVGTGEPNFSADSFFGVGIYRIDNASTVSPIITGPLNKDATNADVFTGRAIGEILVHPTDPNTIFVASASGVGGIGAVANNVLPSRGVYRSTNAMTASPTFAKLTGLLANANVSVRDIILDPLNPNLLVVNPINATVNAGGIYVSTDALAVSPTFTQRVIFNSGSTSELTAEFAIQHTVGNPNPTIYAAVGNVSGGLYINTDGGTTWTLQNVTNFCSPQCFYDIAVDVDPTNAATVYLGGAPALIFGRSIDSGVAFTTNATTAIGLHGDTHAIAVARSSPSTIYFGSDGGISKSIDGGITWTPLNNSTFRATQFMSIAVHPIDANFTIGGTQDNGTNYYRPNATWTRADFGDGGFAVIDQSAVDTTTVNMFHTYFNASSLQGYAFNSSPATAFENWSFRGCQSSGTTVNGITCNGTVLFYAPLEQGPGTPNTIYYGSDRLYRSADLGVTHTVVSQNPIAAGAPISAIGISRQNDNVRIVGQSTGGIFGTSVGSATLTDLDPTNVVPNNYVARAVVDPNNATTAYVTLNAFGVTNVWKTTTLSSLYDENSLAPTWTAANSGLPAVPVNAFVVDPLDSNRLYAGTDIGVYNSIDGGANWLPFGTGLPRVAVFDMAITAGRLLRIATHGRGMWQTPAVGTTASNVSVSGRILASNGSGIPRATVRMVDLQGNTREVKSNSFGYYSFEGVASGQNYAFLISAKGHEFQPQVRTISEAVDDLNFAESN